MCASAVQTGTKNIPREYNHIWEVEMDLIYKSTRNNQETATASEAILKGLAGEIFGRTFQDELSGSSL